MRATHSGSDESDLWAKTKTEGTMDVDKKLRPVAKVWSRALFPQLYTNTSNRHVTVVLRDVDKSKQTII